MPSGFIPTRKGYFEPSTNDWAFRALFRYTISGGGYNGRPEHKPGNQPFGSTKPITTTTLRAVRARTRIGAAR
jgi:hypothetical protein